MIRIVADENIAALGEYFADCADIRCVSGRDLAAADLKGADALLVRSVTRVDERLLAASDVQFVGSATIGLEHVDTAFLRAAGITFHSAPGSNADSVADYVCSALAALIPDLASVAGAGLRAGVIGLGQVGRRVARRLAALGYAVRAYDPFLDAADYPVLDDLPAVLQADLLSLHVPLTRSGPHPTRHMFDAQVLASLPAELLLLNTCRGGVMDSQALKNELQHRAGWQAVLDVWEGEPRPDPELVAMSKLATAHIAGYAYDGKLRGTAMLAEQFRQHFGIDQTEAPFVAAAELMPVNEQQSLNDMLLQAYDIRQDDTALRQSLAEPDPGQSFDALRKHYPRRREFSAIHLQPSGAGMADRLATLRALGFGVKEHN